jgi:O-antigen ligase
MNNHATTISHRNSLFIGILLAIFGVIFLFGLLNFTTIYATGFVLALGLFVLAFVDIRAGFIVIILATLLSPEITIPTRFLRDVSLRLEDFLLIVVFFAWLGRLAIKAEYRFIKTSPIDLPILLILIINFISTARGILLKELETTTAIFYNLKVIEFTAIYFILANSLRTSKEVKFFLAFILITAGIVALYGLPQVPQTEIFTAQRLTAPFEGKPEPNTLGAYLMIILGISICLWLFMEKSGLKFWFGMFILLIFIPLLFTLSRGAYAATLGMLFLIAILSKRKWLLALLVIFLLLSPIILPRQIIERALYNFQDPRYWGFADPSLADRINVYKKAFNNLQSSPLLGHGVTGGGNILDSQYARILIETGLIGFILFWWLIVRMFKIGFRLYKNSLIGWIKGLGLAYIVVLFGLLIHSFGNITFYIVRIMEPFWVFTAFICVLYKEQFYTNQNIKIAANT